MSLLDITQHEIEALKHVHNVSDAHTHQSQSATQSDIVRRLPELWYEAESMRQYDMEQRFLSNFFRVRRQPSAMKNAAPLLVYAASIAMAITANYLMKKRMSVGLMHPCFDNIVDLLKHMQVGLQPLQETWFRDPKQIYANLQQNLKSDAIFIIDPNNPTGFTLNQHGREGWSELIRFAKDNHKLLIFDFCFSSFMLADERYEIPDIYEMLDAAGVSYIAMEDTGKTWPLQDTKASILKTSVDIYKDVYNIHTAYLLNVSPFILNVLTEYVLDSERDNFASVTSLLERNRAIARDILADSLLEPVASMTRVSVLWCKIRDPRLSATDLKAYLTRFGIHLLPGTYFYWADHTTGEHFVRIALARNSEVFTPAMQALRAALDTLEATMTATEGHLDLRATPPDSSEPEQHVNLENTGFVDQKELNAFIRSRRSSAPVEASPTHQSTEN